MPAPPRCRARPAPRGAAPLPAPTPPPAPIASPPAAPQPSGRAPTSGHAVAVPAPAASAAPVPAAKPAPVEPAPPAAHVRADRRPRPIVSPSGSGAGRTPTLLPRVRGRSPTIGEAPTPPRSPSVPSAPSGRGEGRFQDDRGRDDRRTPRFGDVPARRQRDGGSGPRPPAPAEEHVPVNAAAGTREGRPGRTGGLPAPRRLQHLAAAGGGGRRRAHPPPRGRRGAEAAPSAFTTRATFLQALAVRVPRSRRGRRRQSRRLRFTEGGGRYLLAKAFGAASVAARISPATPAPSSRRTPASSSRRTPAPRPDRRRSPVRAPTQAERRPTATSRRSTSTSAAATARGPPTTSASSRSARASTAPTSAASACASATRS